MKIYFYKCRGCGTRAEAPAPETRGINIGFKCSKCNGVINDNDILEIKSLPTDSPLISFVVPFYKKFDQWEQAMAKQYNLAKPWIEIVLVIDSPEDEKDVVEAIKTKWGKDYKFLVLVNDKVHDWRPPSATINVGIKNAFADHIAVISPESVVLLPDSDYLKHKVRILNIERRWVGGCWMNVPSEWIEKLDDYGPEYWALYAYHRGIPYYGFLLAKKSDFVRVNGYDEDRIVGSQEDADIRERLTHSGLSMDVDQAIRIAHIKHDVFEQRHMKDTHAMNPYVVLANQPNWGTEFNRVAYDWKKQ